MAVKRPPLTVHRLATIQAAHPLSSPVRSTPSMFVHTVNERESVTESSLARKSTYKLVIDGDRCLDLVDVLFVGFNRLL